MEDKRKQKYLDHTETGIKHWAQSLSADDLGEFLQHQMAFSAHIAHARTIASQRTPPTTENGSSVTQPNGKRIKIQIEED